MKKLAEIKRLFPLWLIVAAGVFFAGAAVFFRTYLDWHNVFLVVLSAVLMIAGFSCGLLLAVTAGERSVSAKGQPGVSCPISELICRALVAGTGAEVALHGTLSTTGLPANREILGRDLFAVIPYENTAVTAEVTAEELEAIVAEQWKGRKIYTYSGVWGADVIIDADGQAHITGIGPSHAAPVPNRRYRLVLNSHTAAGGGRAPMLRRILEAPATACKDTGLSTRELLRAWLKDNPDDFTITPHPWLRIAK